jgi:hypothetical protein
MFEVMYITDSNFDYGIYKDGKRILEVNEQKNANAIKDILEHDAKDRIINSVITYESKNEPEPYTDIAEVYEFRLDSIPPEWVIQRVKEDGVNTMLSAHRTRIYYNMYIDVRKFIITEGDCFYLDHNNNIGILTKSEYQEYLKAKGANKQ